MKKNLTTITLVLVLCLSFIGCNNADKEIDVFVAAWNASVNQIVEKAEKGDVDGAKATWDESKANFKAKWNTLKDAGSSESKTKVNTASQNNLLKMMNLITDFQKKFPTNNLEKSQKLLEISNEYSDIFKF